MRKQALHKIIIVQAGIAEDVGKALSSGGHSVPWYEPRVTVPHCDGSSNMVRSLLKQSSGVTWVLSLDI